MEHFKIILYIILALTLIVGTVFIVGTLMRIFNDRKGSMTMAISGIIMFIDIIILGIIELLEFFKII
jgi:predicted permease